MFRCRFDIKCMWLSLKQLSMLCRNLVNSASSLPHLRDSLFLLGSRGYQDEIAAENAGCPLLLQWVRLPFPQLVCCFMSAKMKVLLSRMVLPASTNGVAAVEGEKLTRRVVFRRCGCRMNR